MQANLEQLNEEYAAKCASGRLLPVEVREVPAGTWNRMRSEKTGARGNFEEYKHVYLVQDLAFVERLTAANSDSADLPIAIPLTAASRWIAAQTRAAA